MLVLGSIVRIMLFGLVCVVMFSVLVIVVSVEMLMKRFFLVVRWCVVLMVWVLLMVSSLL